MYFRNVFSGYSVDREGYSKSSSDNLHKKHNGLLLYGTYVHNVPYAQCPIEVQSQGRKKQALSPLESHRRVTRREKVQGPIKKVLSRNGVQNPPRLQSTLFLPQCDKILGKHSCTGWAPLYVRRVVDNSEIQLQTDRDGF